MVCSIMYFAAWIRERPIDIAAHSRSCSQRAQSHALRADDALAGCRRLLATLAACQRPQQRHSRLVDVPRLIYGLFAI